MGKANKGTEKQSNKTRAVKESGKSHKTGSGKVRKRYAQIVFRDWCKACGICSAFCPKHVIDQDDSGAPVFAHPDRCIGCRFCEFHCPDFAITILERQPKAGNNQG